MQSVSFSASDSKVPVKTPNINFITKKERKIKGKIKNGGADEVYKRPEIQSEWVQELYFGV